MPRSILEIAQEAAEREATAAPPVSLFDSTNNRIARILRVAAKDTMRDYMRQGGWQGLSELHSTWTFNTRPGVFAYPLPPDFLRPIPRTEQRDGWPMGLLGPASPQTWAAWISGMEAVTAPMGWRIRNNLLWIEPPPAEAEILAIDYVSRYPVVGTLSITDLDLTTTPISVITPAVPRDGYLAVTNAGLAIDADATDGLFDTDGVGWDVGTYADELWNALRRINPMSAAAPLPQVRRAEFTEDTDTPAFDDDYLLSLGMHFRLRRALGLNYAEAAAEYEAEMDIKANADAAQAGRMIPVGGQDDGYDVLPLGAGKWMLS